MTVSFPLSLTDCLQHNAPNSVSTNSSAAIPATVTSNGAISWAARISKIPSVAPPQLQEQEHSGHSHEPSSEISSELTHTTSDHSEYNISFGNVPISASNSSSIDAIILPSSSTAAHPISHSSTKENKVPPHSHSSPNGEPIILSSSHEQLEYVPISFGAFEATVPSPPVASASSGPFSPLRSSPCGRSC
jgi:hypothetical protein